MKMFFIKTRDGNVGWSSMPMAETGAESFEFEVTEEDATAVQEGLKAWVITDGVLSTRNLH